MLSKKAYVVLNLCSMLVFTLGFVMLEAATAIGSDELKEVSTVKPIVYVDCPEVADLGEIIIVHVRVFNLTPTYYEEKPCGNLYGFEIVLQWNSTLLEYVSHRVRIPVETYPDGVLHGPVLAILDEVNAAAGTYKLAYASRAPAKPFNNPNASNTFFTMNFRVKSYGGTDLKLTTVKLSDDKGKRIYPEVLDGAFRTPTAPVARFFTVPESYPVVNKTVVFNASVSYDPDGNITKYIWDFGDGKTIETQYPVVSYQYSKAGDYKVKLRVTDDSSLSSPTYSKTLKVVQRRNLTVKEIAIPSLEVYHGEQVTINVTVENNGDVFENFKVSLNYNTTADGNWVLIEEKETSLPKGAKRTLSFTFDTSKVAALNCSLFLLANATVIHHEENITDNTLKTTDPIRVLSIEFHDIAVLGLDVKAVSKVGKEFAPPLIKGERVKVFFKVQTKGNVDEEYSVSVNVLTSNGTFVLSYVWDEEFLKVNTEKNYSYIFNEPISLSGNYIVTVNVTIKNQVDMRPSNNYMETLFIVIEQPKIEIIAPKIAYVGEEVSFKAKADAKTPILYKWTRIKPGGVDEINRRERKDIVYTFNIPGNWTVRLRITDGFGITFDAEREATATYKVETTITIIEKTEALTLKPWTMPVLGLVIAIIFIAVFRYFKLRRS